MMKRDAKFSTDKKYRYLLTRVWDEELPIVTFIGLNPSVADDVEDDPTTGRCLDFAQKWGFGGFNIVNLFAYISTEKSVLKRVDDPIGTHNDSYILSASKSSDMVIAAWGNDGKLLKRSKEVRAIIPLLHCLKINVTREPQHPLYVKGDAVPFLYLR